MTGKSSEDNFGHCNNLLKQIATVRTPVLTKIINICID